MVKTNDDYYKDCAKILTRLREERLQKLLRTALIRKGHESLENVICKYCIFFLMHAATPFFFETMKKRELLQLEEYLDDGVHCGRGVFAKPKFTKRTVSKPVRYQDEQNKKQPHIRLGSNYQAAIPTYVGPYCSTTSA